VSSHWRHDRRKTSEAIGSFFLKRFSSSTAALVIGIALALVALPVPAKECPAPQRGMSRLVPTLQKAINPNHSEADIELPMPCGGKLVLRHVCIPAEGFFGDLRFDLGCVDCGRGRLGFMEGRWLFPATRVWDGMIETIYGVFQMLSLLFQQRPRNGQEK